MFMKRVGAAVGAVVLGFGSLTLASAAAYGAAPMPAAQFAATTGTASCSAGDALPASYVGEFAAKLQMTELLKPFESEVKSEANAGHFPWDKETVSTSASFTYTVTFPQGAQVGAAAVAESSSMIASVKESAVSPDGLTHTFKIKLNDVNWAQIYQGYQADLADPAAHTVDITIPYTAVVNTKDEAAPLEGAAVTATGSFSFYPSRTWGRLGIGLQTFAMDTASSPLAAGISALPCIAAEPTPPDPIDPPSPSEPTLFEQEGVLPGDLLGAVDSGAADTEHDAVAVAEGRSSVLALTGALYVDDIRQQMVAIEKQYSQTAPDFADIAISEADFSFTAALTLPVGMAFTDASKSAVLSGSADFEVSSVEVAGQVVTVKFALTDAAKEKVKTYGDLKAVVDAAQSPLQVTVSGVTFTADSTPDTEYTVTGEVSGRFSALASKSAATGGRDIRFAFTWNGEQKAGLEDAKAQDGITYTVKYKAEAPIDPTPDEPEPSKPEPNEPEPSKPEPTKPEPSKPQSAQPVTPKKGGLAATGTEGGVLALGATLFTLAGVAALRRRER